MPAHNTSALATPPADENRPLELTLDTLISTTRFMPPPRRHIKSGRPISGALGEGAQISRQRGSGDELDSIGPFQDGDDPRHIDWSASARTGRPQVRRFLAKVHRPCVIFVDLRAPMYFGTHWCVPAMQACLQAAALSAFLQRRQEPFAIVGIGSAALPTVEQQRYERVGRQTRFRAGMLERLQKDYSVALSGQHDNAETMTSLLSTTLKALPFDYDAVVISDFGQTDSAIAASLSKRRAYSVHALVVNDPIFDGGWRSGHYPGRLHDQTGAQVFRVPNLKPEEQQKTLQRWREQSMQLLADVGFGAIWEPAHQLPVRADQ